jgi:hypothetical protein
MLRWHTVDLTNFDVAPAARRVRNVSYSVAQRGAGMAKDAAYVGVGFGLLAFQRAQVQRRQIERTLRS